VISLFPNQPVPVLALKQIFGIHIPFSIFSQRLKLLIVVLNSPPEY
jgi:hypothetical protein